jgi:hypothetical protein
MGVIYTYQNPNPWNGLLMLRAVGLLQESKQQQNNVTSHVDEIGG